MPTITRITETGTDTQLRDLGVSDCFTVDGIVYMLLGKLQYGSMALSDAVMDSFLGALSNPNPEDPWYPVVCLHNKIVGGLTAMKGTTPVKPVSRAEIHVDTIETPKVVL